MAGGQEGDQDGEEDALDPMDEDEDPEEDPDEDPEEDDEMGYEDEEEADVPSAEHMSVGSTEVHDMLLGADASPARAAPAGEASRR